MIRAVNLSIKVGSFKLENVSLTVDTGEYLVVLGPSGAGKTILLECLARLRKPEKGKIFINEVDVTDEPPEKRGLAFVPQNYALWPHMSVYGNIAYPLKIRKLRREEIKLRVNEIARELGITNLLHRRPDTLSGGEQQRVALARALSIKPKAILLDEPTAALHPGLRSSAWKLLKSLHKKLGFTAIHVTHDVAEASYLATKAAFLWEGRIVKEGSLEEVLSTKEASNYLGDTNFLHGIVKGFEDNVAVVDAGGVVLRVVDQNLNAGDEVTLTLRPEDIVLLREKPQAVSARNCLLADIIELEVRGVLILVKARVKDSLNLKAYVTKASVDHLGVQEGSKVYLMFKASALRLL